MCCICFPKQAFGSVASIEAAYFATTGKQLLLSEQNLIDCAWDYGNTGCLGGFQELAYEYMGDVLQIATEEVGGTHPSARRMSLDSMAHSMHGVWVEGGAEPIPAFILVQGWL